MRIIYLTTALCCLGWTVKAQDTLKTVSLNEVVVTGTKSEIPVEKSGKTIFKVTRHDIESSTAQTVGDILNNVAGVQINGNLGTLGSDISYSLRGANSKSALVLIDGVPMNDPSQISSFYDFRLLDLSQVESIEVLKGGLSTLYGTGAAAGVISITLKKSKNDGFNGSLDASYGSFNTLRHGFNIGEKGDNISWMLNGCFMESDGFSAAKDTANSDFDKDGFVSNNVKLNIGIDTNDKLRFDVTTTFDQMDLDFDNGAYLDANNSSNEKRYTVGLSPTYQYDKGKLVARMNYIHNHRLFNFDGFEYLTKGFNKQVDLFADHHLSDQIKVIGGINYQHMSYGVEESLSRDTTKFTLLDPYISLMYHTNDGFNLQIGGRLNSHSEYGSYVVYNINPSYTIDFSEGTFTKIYTSYATSFVSPGLYQLYDQFSGSIDLKPEESANFELGASIGTGQSALNVAYFIRRDENLIDFDYGTFRYFNRGEDQHVSGIEMDGNFSPGSNFGLSIHYTYVNVSDTILYRVPEHKYGLGINYGSLQSIQLGLNYLHLGQRNDVDPSGENGLSKLEAVDLLDFKVSKLFGKLRTSFTVENLTNEDYEFVRGFNSRERNYRLSLNYQLN